MPTLHALLFVLIAALCPTLLKAEIFALLVGVSEYDEPAIADLRGPSNDVRLMRDVLSDAGVGQITVLASGVEGAEPPLYASIVRELTNLVTEATRGDLVYIHLSGHGSRQVDLNRDETDGLDEIFLPMDVERGPNGSSTVPNALTDDEIEIAVARIRATGADVFFVMDSCHSGSGLRSANTFSAERQVAADSLNLDLSMGEQGGSAVKPPIEEGDDWGGYLAFYATRSNDVAREVDMSLGSAVDEDQWYGLFTSAIAARIEGGQSMSYRQLFQGVLGDLNSGGAFGMAAVQTPLWEGTMIDEPVLQRETTPKTVRYLLNDKTMNAGQVHGIQTGTLMALVADASDASDAVIGYAQVESITPRTSVLRSVAPDCEPRSSDLCALSGSLAPEAQFAQIELAPLDELIGFSPLLSLEAQGLVAPNAPIQQRFADALGEASRRSGIAAAASASVYRVEILLENNVLWFGPTTRIEGALVGTSFDLGDEDERLILLLDRILRAERLTSSLEQIDAGGSFLSPSPVTIDASLFASDATRLSKVSRQVDPIQECRSSLAGMSEAGFQPLAPQTDMKQCDMVRFSAAGNRTGQRDVNRIHIDAHYCIDVEYELIEGSQASRQLGDPMVLCSECPGPDVQSAGHERLFVLISELKENQEALNLSGQIENCGGPQSGLRSSAAASALGDALIDVKSGGVTRGSMGLGGALTEIWVQSYNWRILPRDLVLTRVAED